MNQTNRYDLPLTFHCWGHRLTGEAAQVRSARWSRYRYNIPGGLGENGAFLTGSQEHIALSRMVAQDGMVLLENNGLLPLKKGTRVALFGIGSLDYIKGGGGSGMVYSRYVSNLYHGFAQKEPFYRIYKPLTDFYYRYAMGKLTELGQNQLFAEPMLPDALVMDAANYADVAVITISRFSCEGHDRAANKGDYYLSDGELAMLRQITEVFEHSVVVLNIGGVMDTSWIRENPKIDAALLAWQAGMEGGAAIADILCGDVNPSGKLTDTFAKSYCHYPSAQTFGESDDYVNYEEDIYVGYRYFETIPGAAKQVVYPFGYGLSYTSFALSKPLAELCGDVIRITVGVKNTGACRGREVVQVYYSAPRGKLGKSRIALAAFQKTRLLEPGQQQIVTLSFPVADMASYDDQGVWQEAAYILEKGAYCIFAGNQCRDLQMADWRYEVTQDFMVVRQLAHRCAPTKSGKRMQSDGSFAAVTAAPVKTYDIPAPENSQKVADAEKTYILEQVAKGELSLDAFVSQLWDKELIALVGGIPNRGLANTAGMGGIQRLGIPPVMTADGPAGIRLEPETGIAVTAWPCATLLACTWDLELAEQVGKAGGIEAKENAIAIWLTPGMNIHRDPLCGRNFEYFSEDPLITGKMGAAMVRGMQSVGTAASVKHFAANNKETNRLYSDSRLSERALREIYLRGFEICVKEAQPWTVMTGYHILNGVRCCENYELIELILRQEWGYQGMVTTDWDVPCDQAKCVKVGNDIRMPAGKANNIQKALEAGTLHRGHLEQCAKHILEMILKLD